MKIYIGSDHAGFLLKEEIKKALIKDYEVIDCGTNSTDSVDYPDCAHAVCSKMQEGDYGILVCFTGIGMSIAANKHHGIRAALVGRTEDAILTREHNDANVLCLSAKNTPIREAKSIVKAFLSTSFTGGRHQRRVDKIRNLEQWKKKRKKK